MSIAFARANARGYPYPVKGGIRDEVLVAAACASASPTCSYETPYTRRSSLRRHNAGRYASRNAAFQNALTQATGIPLALDGDLLVPGAALDEPGLTETAVRSLASQLGMSDRQIRRQLERAGTLEFSESTLHRRVFELGEAAAGQALPRAMIPGIRLESPKITRQLTTEWFATRAHDRYRNCLKR